MAIAAVLILTICFTSAGYNSFGIKQENSVWVMQPVSGSVIRLHVIAESNDPHSQQFKMKIVREVQRQLAEDQFCRFGIEHKLKLQHNLARLEEQLRCYAATLPGYSPPIAVSLVQEEFPLRAYGRNIFPPGNYTAVKVVLGAGQGDNWWCLLFPALCLPLAEADDSVENRFTRKKPQEEINKKPGAKTEEQKPDSDWRSYIADKWNLWF
ncbi:MAG: stage II sporulation protein R [Dethiobacter sp.]|jgi:stage II sporulation protein R|nr:stage II sporulation protein R [Dethiobacter sp.]